MGTKVWPVPGGDFVPSGNFNTREAGESGPSLTVNTDRWLDPNNGSDSNDGSQAFPWLTFAPFSALVESYEAIDGCYARLHILEADPGNEPLFTAMQVPALRNRGKVVILGEGVITAEAESPPSTFVANGSSSTTLVATDTYPLSNDPIGWQARCIAGANLGVRTQFTRGTYVGGGAASLRPAAPLVAAGIGDTWELVRPAARLYFPDTEILSGAGRTPVGSTDGDDAGVYIANLCILNAPKIQLSCVWLYACEYFADGTFPANGLEFTDCLVGFGIVAGDMPWIDADAGLWNGCGLTQRRETVGSVSVGTLLSQFSNSELDGYVCGTSWQVASGRANFYGGALFGEFSGTNSSLKVYSAGYMDARGTTALPLAITASGARHSIECTDPNSVCDVGSVILAAATGTLLRSSDWALINVTTTGAAPSGSSTGYAQDATGEGRIIWDGQPALTGTAGALAANGATAPNSVLASAETVFRVGLSLISRRVSGTPDATLQQPNPFPGWNAKSGLSVVVDGTPVTLVPAAPSGYVNVVLAVVISNSGAAAGTYIVESGGLFVAASSSIAAGSTSNIINPAGTAPYITAAAVTARRSAGTSVSGVCRVLYVQIPTLNLLVQNIALTAAFQSLPALIPPAGRVSRLWLPGLTASVVNLGNGDNVTHGLTAQLTRSAVVYAVNGATVVAAAQRLAAWTPPVLQPGDLLEVKTSEAITTPGTVTLSVYMELVPEIP